MAHDELRVPAGAPIRVYEWLTPPLLLVGLAAVEVFESPRNGPHAVTPFGVTAAILLVVSALALWTYGYRAFRDLTPRSVERYASVWTLCLFVAGVLMSFALSPVEFFPLVFAGSLASERQFRLIRLARIVMPRRLWLRTAVISAIVGALCILLQPLAFGLGFVPLVVIVMVGRIVGPLLFGFAFRLRPRASGPF